MPVAVRADQVWNAEQTLAKHGAHDSKFGGNFRSRITVALRDVRVRDSVLGRMAEISEPQALLGTLVRVALSS